MADVTDIYYAGEAFIGYGSQFLVGQDDGSPETFVAVPDINTITQGDMTTGVVDITHLRSLARHREKKGTLRDSGPITLSGNYRPTHGAHKLAGGDSFSASHNLLALWRNVTECNFQLVYPDREDAGATGSPLVGVTLMIVGLVTKYQIGAVGLEEKVSFTCDITPLRDYFVGPS